MIKEAVLHQALTEPQSPAAFYTDWTFMCSMMLRCLEVQEHLSGYTWTRNSGFYWKYILLLLGWLQAGQGVICLLSQKLPFGRHELHLSFALLLSRLHRSSTTAAGLLTCPQNTRDGKENVHWTSTLPYDIAVCFLSLYFRLITKDEEVWDRDANIWGFLSLN